MSPLVWIILACLSALLIAAAVTDCRCRRIPNALTGSVAMLYPVWVIASPADDAYLVAAALALGFFAIGALLFTWGVLGGGDVKLISVLALFAGPSEILPFLVTMSMTGGAMALVTIVFDRSAPLIAAQLAAFGVEPTRIPWMHSLIAFERPSLPYGVAIAAGGLAIVLALLNSNGG